MVTTTRIYQRPAPLALADLPSLVGARVVVTGAAGFIGGHLLRAIIASGADRVVAVDTALIPAIPSAASVRTEVTHVRASILQPLDDALDGADIVFHLAAHVSVPRSLSDPLSDSAANVTGTIALLESCRRAGVQRIVYSSSAAVYGIPEYLPVDEIHPVQPRSPYGLSKLTGERYCLLYAQIHGLSAIALRYFNVYGPNQAIDGGYAAVIPRFLDRVARDLPLAVDGDGSQTRDFIHVSDVVRANLLAGVSRYEGVLNVGSGEATSVAELARLIGGPAYPITWGPPRVGDIPHSVAATDAAREALGFRARTSLASGLAALR